MLLFVQNIKYIILFLLIAGLSACGGSSSNEEPPPSGNADGSSSALVESNAKDAAKIIFDFITDQHVQNFETGDVDSGDGENKNTQEPNKMVGFTLFHRSLLEEDGAAVDGRTVLEPYCKSEGSLEREDAADKHTFYYNDCKWVNYFGHTIELNGHISFKPQESDKGSEYTHSWLVDYKITHKREFVDEEVTATYLFQLNPNAYQTFKVSDWEHEVTNNQTQEQWSLSNMYLKGDASKSQAIIEGVYRSNEDPINGTVTVEGEKLSNFKMYSEGATFTISDDDSDITLDVYKEQPNDIWPKVKIKYNDAEVHDERITTFAQ